MLKREPSPHFIHTAGHQGGLSSTGHPLPHAGTPQRPSTTGPTEGDGQMPQGLHWTDWPNPQTLTGRAPMGPEEW